MTKMDAAQYRSGRDTVSDYVFPFTFPAASPTTAALSYVFLSWVRKSLWGEY